MKRAIAGVVLVWGVAHAAGKPYEKAALEGEALRKSGRYAEALRVLEPAANVDEAHHARLELGLTYRLMGEPQKAKAIWNRFFDDYETNNLDKKSARQLTYVAIAAKNLNSIKDANDLFREAVDADPKGKEGARANVEWAALFLDKYDAGHAEQSLDEALKVTPDDAEAHYLMARVKLEQGYDVPAAEKELALALKKDPKHAGALAQKAELLVDAEDYEGALKACQAVWAVNPEDLRAHTVAAAAHLLLEDQAGYQRERERVLKVNPTASQFFHGVAEMLVKEHRYPEANELEKQAIALDPKDYVAQAALGSNLLRLGEDQAGVEALGRAWDGDHYNVRTYNLLNLFEKVIPHDYTMIEGKPFRFRVATKEKPILERYVKPMVEREWKELTKRYGFVPDGPVTMELYEKPEHYAVRTVGLPGLEALGVTFGKVITAQSPSLARFNWGMALWHEVGHVFSIQLSRSRVPRWFTEGLAEWETQNQRPEWTRRTHAELYHGLAEGKLLPIVQLNAGFTRARDVSHIVIAYHQAAEEVAFLIRRWGFPKAVEALKLYAQGKSTREVIPAVTGLACDAYDRAFQEDLRARLKPYEGTFFVRNSDYSDVDGLRDQLKAAPNDLRVKGLLALGLVRARQGEEAQKLIGDDVLKRADAQQQREIILAGAELAAARKDWPLAKKLYAGLAAQPGGDGYDARFGLLRVAAAQNDLPEAEKQAQLAKGMDPDLSDPYEVLAKLYLKTPGREESAVDELEQAAKLDCMDPSVPKLLVEKHAAKARWAKVAEWAQLALYTDPFDAATHLRYARALIELGRARESLGEIDAALACEHDEAQKKEAAELEQKAGRI
jgi:tetratricopeptide (TPR) repeat protein